MSHVTLTCPCCEITGRVRKKYAGRNVACKHCGHSFKMPPPGDCISKLVRSSAKTVWVKVKSLTEVKRGRSAERWHEMRKLILLREQGVITQREFDELRRRLRD